MKLYIADKDPFYVLDLKEAFLRNVEGISRIGVVSNINTLSDLNQEELEKYDVLLMNEEIEMGIEVALPIITYSSNEASNGLNRFSDVFEFKAAIEASLKVQYKAAQIECVTEVIIVTSLSENVGVTTVALSTAEILKSKGKVLYLQLTQFGDQFLYFNDESSSSLSNVLYEYKNDRDIPVDQLIENTVFDTQRGIYHYGDVSNYFDLQLFNEKRLVDFVLDLKHTKNYRYIVIDLKLTLGQAAFSLMGHSDKTVFVCDYNEVSCIKTNKFYEDLKWIELYHELNILGKAELWLNRFRMERNVSSINWEKWKIVKKTPYVKDHVFMQHGKYYVKKETAFYKSIEVNLENWYV